MQTFRAHFWKSCTETALGALMVSSKVHVRLIIDIAVEGNMKQPDEITLAQGNGGQVCNKLSKDCFKSSIIRY